MTEKFEIIASQNPTPARPLNSRFLVLFLSLVPNITSKHLLNGESRLLQTTYPQPSLFEERGLTPPQVFPRLRGEYGTSEKRESWRPARSARGVWWERGQSASRGWWEGKERKLHFVSPSYHSFRPLSLTINWNIPQKVIASDWEQCRGGEGEALHGL